MAGFTLTNISKSFGPTKVLQDISLHAEDGEFVVLLGPSGCGKSTLLRIIAGLEEPSGGSVAIGGQLVDSLPPRDRDVAMVFQQYALYPHLSVGDNLAFGLRMRHEPESVIEDRIQEAADLLEIHDLLDRKPRDLSGGQRQRVAMGRAIVRKPRLFLFDEPLSNLDARLRTAMRMELKKLHQRLGVTMVYVTHDQIEAMTLGETIVVLENGHIQQVGTPEAIYHHPRTTFVARFIGSPAMNLIDGIVQHTEGIVRFTAGDFQLVLPLQREVLPPDEPLAATLGIRPEDICLLLPKTVHGTFQGRIDVLENLGADHLLYSLIQGHGIVIRTHPDSLRKAGQTLTMYFPLNRLHLFMEGVRVGME